MPQPPNQPVLGPMARVTQLVRAGYALQGKQLVKGDVISKAQGKVTT